MEKFMISPFRGYLSHAHKGLDQSGVAIILGLSAVTAVVFYRILGSSR